MEYIGSKKKTEQILVGFSAETDNVIENSLKKIQKKNLDFIVANDVSEKDSGFGKNSNFSFLISKDGKTKELGLISKELLSKEIADKVKEIRLSSS